MSNGNEGVLCIPQSSSITGTSPSDCLMSYSRTLIEFGGVLPLCRGAVSVFYNPSRQGASLGGSYPSAEKQSVYSTASADWAIHRVNVKTVLFQIIQFHISTQFRGQNSSISIIQFSINTQFKSQNSSILNNSI